MVDALSPRLRGRTGSVLYRAEQQPQGKSYKVGGRGLDLGPARRLPVSSRHPVGCLQEPGGLGTEAFPTPCRPTGLRMAELDKTEGL